MNGLLTGSKRRRAARLMTAAAAAFVAALGLTGCGGDKAGFPVINEVLCSNSSSYKAYDGRYYDWVELYNPSSSELSLDDYYLSDDPEAPTKTPLRGQRVPAHGYLVIYCSGLDLTDERGLLHTNFKLSASDGETVCVTNGTSVISLAVPPSKANVSYGLADDGKTYTWYETPTPGKKNGETPAVRDFPVRINEFMIANSFTIYDCEGDSGDWVELYNTSEQAVDLSGMSLTDDEETPDKYVFPEGTGIGGNAYLLVFCDGKNKKDAKGLLHASFSLSAGDGAVALYSADKTLVGRAAVTDMPSDISRGWDDADGEYRFYARPTPGSANTSTPFRKLSEEMHPAPRGDVIISEALSASGKNVKSGKTDFIELYNTTSKSISLKGYTVSKGAGKAGYTLPDVTIAAGAYVVIYCDGASGAKNGSLHAPFKLGMGGDTLYIADTKGIVCDIFATGKGRAGVSSGRVGKDASRRYFFTTPTPGKANSGSRYTSYAPVPRFSAEGGVVKSGVSVRISVDEPYKIRYTTDGSEPTSSSSLYTSPISINRNTVIRAAAFGGDSLMSDCVTQTYLTENPHTLPIFCICGRQSALLDKDGIFSNQENNGEYKIYAEYFNTNGVKETQFPCGVKLFGHSSREMPQKGVKLTLREMYGLSEITYPFFSGNEKAAATRSTLLLRPSGEDQIYSRLRDELIPNLLRGRMDLDYEEAQPCAFYVNGEYRGLYYIREALNADYLKRYYGYRKGDFDIIKAQMQVQEGSFAAYKKMTNFCKTHDLRQQKNYEEIRGIVDFDSLINFWIVETYFGNTDTVNIRCYKHKNGKWRWMVYDMDWSMQTAKYIRERNFIDWHLLNPKGHGIGHFDNSLIRGLLQNSEFRARFITAYCYHIENTFAPERAAAVLDQMAQQIDGEIKLNEKLGYRPAYKTWSGYTVPYLRHYLRDRPAEMKKALMESFHLSESDWAHYMTLAKDYKQESEPVK